MLRIFRLPAALLLAFTTFINFSFSLKEESVSKKSIPFYLYNDSANTTKVLVPEKIEKAETEDVYSMMNLDKKGLSKQAFDLALKGYNKLLHKRLIRNKNILTVIDFSKPSNQKRLFVLDIKKKKVLIQTLVAHGRNSGLEYATDFSNETDSHKSSLGFYVTLGTYIGEHGYALKIKGCEKGI